MSETSKPRRSWPQRILSLETLLALVAVGLLIAGSLGGNAMGVFWGVLVLVGLTALHFVRKKDWEKHWREHGRRDRR